MFLKSIFRRKDKIKETNGLNVECPAGSNVDLEELAYVPEEFIF